MIKMCDIRKYHDVDPAEIQRMKDAHVVLNHVDYKPQPIVKGYTDKILTIDVTDASVKIADIPAEVKEKYCSPGSEGFTITEELKGGSTK